jgi:hypothetical protein
MAGLVPAMTTKGSSWEGTGFHADETGATAPNSGYSSASRVRPT